MPAGCRRGKAGDSIKVSKKEMMIVQKRKTEMVERKKIMRKYLALLAKGVKIFLHLLMPVVSFILFEYVTGNLLQISRPFAVMNCLWVFVIYLVVFGLLGNTRLSLPIVSFFLYVLSLAETFVMGFRGNPIMLWDILSLQTAMTVADNYAFEISMEMKTAGIILLNINYFLFLIPVRVKGVKKRLGAGIGCAGFSAAYAVLFFRYLIPAWSLAINMWAMEVSFNQYGYLLATAVSLQYTVKQPPHGYSYTRLEELALLYAEEAEQKNFSANQDAGQKAEEKAIQPVNLICIMNESLSDLQVAGKFSTNKDYLPFLHGLEENAVKGSLCVPVFGAMTSNTEFEFLTGDSLSLFPVNTIAYQFYVKPKTYSLVSTLSAQGYRTVAMHPYPPENWNREACYANMGFDEFLSFDDYRGSEILRYYISDRANYQKIIEQVEAKEKPDDRLFIFNVTMQNHGGYDEVNEHFPHEIYLTGEYRGKYPKTDQYLSLIKESDKAFAEMVEYFRQIKEPTMIVLFGDHQPSVEDEFYDAIAGRPSGEVPAQDHLMWYQTPYLIWTNYALSSTSEPLSISNGDKPDSSSYPQPGKGREKLGAIFLSSYVLKLANLQMTPYQHFLLQLSEKLPVIHPIGCYEADGTYYSWSQAESPSCPFWQMVLDYKAMAYNHSLDSRKVEALFSLPSAP